MECSVIALTFVWQGDRGYEGPKGPRGAPGVGAKGTKVRHDYVQFIIQC